MFMFGRQQSQQPQTPMRPRATDVAKIQGGGLVQLIVTNQSPLEFFLFLNDRYVPQSDVDSLSLSIEAPNPQTPNGGVYASANIFVNAVGGGRSKQVVPLFPSTVEIVGAGRRLSITARNADSLENLWIDLGLKPDGTGSEITGVQSLRVLIGEGFMDAKLTWEDGETEDLFSTAIP
jgi:hypothetical protein